MAYRDSLQGSLSTPWPSSATSIRTIAGYAVKFLQPLMVDGRISAILAMLAELEDQRRAQEITELRRRFSETAKGAISRRGRAADLPYYLAT